MKFCSNCGVEVVDASVVCVKCGCSVGSISQQPVSVVNPQDAPNAGFAVLSFFLPLIGSVLLLMWYKSTPQKAISCAQGIAISIIVGGVFGIISLLSLSALIPLFASSFGNLF